MDFIFSTLPPNTGKRIADHLWVHASAVDPESLAALRKLITTEHPVPLDDLVIRIDQRKARIANLHYPGFFTHAHPALCCSALVDAGAETVTLRSFATQSNRPILHRKELLVAPTHEAYNEFAALTTDEERLGLLDDKRRIGWSRSWDTLLRDRGLEIEGHEIREFRADDRPQVPAAIVNLGFVLSPSSPTSVLCFQNAELVTCGVRLPDLVEAMMDLVGEDGWRGLVERVRNRFLSRLALGFFRGKPNVTRRRCGSANDQEIYQTAMRRMMHVSSSRFRGAIVVFSRLRKSASVMNLGRCSPASHMNSTSRAPPILGRCVTAAGIHDFPPPTSSTAD